MKRYLWFSMGLLVLIVGGWFLESDDSPRRSADEVSFHTNEQGQRIPPKDHIKLHIIPRMQPSMSPPGH